METSSPLPSRRMQTLLREKDLVYYLVLRIANIVATQMLNVAVGWHIYLMTDSVIALGLVGLVQFAPALLWFPVTGLVADRFDRRHVLVASQIIQGATCCVFLLLMLSGTTQTWPYYITLAFYGSARAFLNPAWRAMLPNLVPITLFPNAVALNSTVGKLSAMGGPAMGGVLIVVVDSWVYGIMAGLFFIAAMTTFGITARPRRLSGEPVTLQVVLGGVSYIRNKSILLGAISLDLFAVLFGTVLGILPVFARDILDVGPEGLGIMRAMPALGAAIVAAFLAQMPPLRPAGPLLFGSLVVYAVCIVAFGLSDMFWLSVVLLAVYGGVDMVSQCIRQTMVQMATPDEMRGRVGAVDSVFTGGSEELGNFRSGIMAAVLGPVGAVVFGGVATIAITALWWRMFPDLRKVDGLDRQI